MQFFSLHKGSRNKAGRNNQGKITCRHRGSRHGRKHRSIGVFNNKFGKYQVLSFHYDPFRRCDLALIKHVDSFFYAYILKAQGMHLNSIIVVSPSQSPTFKNFTPGACFSVKAFPVGSFLHFVGKHSTKNGVFSNSSGCYCTLIQKGKNHCLIKFTSGKVGLISSTALASFGKVGNELFYLKKLKKAGQSRWLGFRPAVRGVAINPVDHPHGGGEGKSSGGRPSVSPWGKLAKK